MVSREHERKRVSRAVLAMTLAGSMALGACATAPDTASAPDKSTAEQPATPPPASQRAQATRDAARYGIAVLAPSMPEAVSLPGPIEAYALSPEPDPCADWVGPPSPAGLQAIEGQEAPGDCARAYPEYAIPEADPGYALGLSQTQLSASRPVLAQSVVPPRKRWFSTVNARPDVTYGDRNWLYKPSEGPTVGLGNLTASAPTWGSSAPIGGFQVSDQFDSASNIGEGKLGYSSSFGRLNLMDPTATQGAVDYGASAGSGTVRYGLTKAVTLEGQMQSARGLTTRGMGTRYNAGDIGTFEAGVTQSSFDTTSATRYRVGYNVTMADSVKLGASAEDIGAGFGDLSSYPSGATSNRQMRSTLSAGLPVQGWGTISGTYSTDVLGSGDPNSRRVGLEQSMLLGPKVQFALGADRDLITGDYEWRARLTMPVESFMRGHWLGF